MTEFILKPYITEKTSSLMGIYKFVFLINGNSSKIEIKKYLSEKYIINIKSVNILYKKSKSVRRGRILGKTKKFKKVIITLKDQNNIDKIKSLF